VKQEIVYVPCEHSQKKSVADTPLAPTHLSKCAEQKSSKLY